MLSPRPALRARRAKSLRLNTSRVGFIGFSAGGHLTAHISTNNSARLYPRVDAADDLSCRPDFAMMVYPAYLINETSATSDTTQVMLNVTADHPPAFLAQTEDDGIKVQNSVYYYLALKGANATPSELHVYPDRNHDAIHGYGRCLRPQITDNEVCQWTTNAQIFMAQLGLARPAGASQSALRERAPA